MQAYQQRVVDEKTALDDKLAKLNHFFHAEQFAKLDADEQNRLRRQSGFMGSYSAVLGERIAAFPTE
jgi:hypothetical protein